ncbi:MAG: ribosome silencing factor [Polyangiaceae bacterium]|nr:ribosome silencing factor [Polyangiaceae bacterium]
MKIKAPVRKDTVVRKGMPRQAASDESRRLALLAAEAGLEKQAIDIEIIDVTGKVDYADFLVIMTGMSDRQVSAIAGEVDQRLSKSGTHPISVEGLPKAHWVLLDFVDVVVHVFLDEERALYDLGGLWMDARRVPVPEAEPVPSSGQKR